MSVRLRSPSSPDSDPSPPQLSAPKPFQHAILCWCYSLTWFLSILTFGLLCSALIILLMSSNTSLLNYITYASKKQYDYPLINGTCTITNLKHVHSDFPFLKAPFDMSVDQCFWKKNVSESDDEEVLVCQKGLVGQTITNAGIGLPVWSVGDRIRCRVADGDAIFIPPTPTPTAPPPDVVSASDSSSGDRLMVDVGKENSMWSCFGYQVTMVGVGSWCLFVMVVATIVCPIASCAFVRGTRSEVKSRAYCACGWGLPILVLFLPVTVGFAILGVMYGDAYFRTFPRPLDNFSCEIGPQSSVNSAAPAYELIPIDGQMNYSSNLWHSRLMDGTPYLNKGDRVHCCVGDSDGVVLLSFMCSKNYRKVLTLMVILCVIGVVVGVFFIAAALVTQLWFCCSKCVDRASGLEEKVPLLQINSRLYSQEF